MSDLGESGTHDCKLDEMLGTARQVGARVQHNLAMREQRGNRRAGYPVDPTDDEGGRGHGRTG